MNHLETSINPVNLFDLEELARQRVNSLAFDYYSSGACDEITLNANVDAYRQIWLRPRMLVDVSAREMTTHVIGEQISAPLMVAPMAFQALAHPDGEMATARACEQFGTIMVLSTLSNFSMEEIAQSSSAKRWFQLYVYKDRSVTRNLVERATLAGCRALVVTVDSPLLGRRERDVRNKFQLPANLKCGNLVAQGFENLPSVEGNSGLAAYIASLYDTSLSWDSISWFRSITDLPILVKGILRADDARRAVDCGASGIIVSNHGGRQLDTTIPSLKALPEIVDEVGREVEVFLDGGIRRGTDILKAIAFGAKAVLIGRPVLWGLGTGGQDGVFAALSMLKNEFDLAMALSGCRSIADIGPDLIYKDKQ